jgi:uncharacterized membrane protein YidH (DUF202 family)
VLRYAGWHTKYYTPGASRQVPRKVPLRLEPKAFFAVERTFLSWMGMSIALGTASTVLSSLAAAPQDPESESYAHVLSRCAVAGIGLLFAPTAMVVLGYAYWIFYSRSKMMRAKEFGFYDDKYGPIVMTCIIGFVLLVLTLTAYFAFL